MEQKTLHTLEPKQTRQNRSMNNRLGVEHVSHAAASFCCSSECKTSGQPNMKVMVFESFTHSHKH